MYSFTEHHYSKMLNACISVMCFYHLVPLCGHTLVFSQLLVDGHLNCFQFLANICVQVCTNRAFISHG
jgi:hypothetical protein